MCSANILLLSLFSETLAGANWFLITLECQSSSLGSEALCGPSLLDPHGSPQQEEQTLYSVPTAFSDFALLLWVQICHLVTVIFLSALLAPALFSLSQMILVNLVTGHVKAHLALGEAEQDVMELDWEAGFGMCSCIS